MRVGPGLQPVCRIAGLVDPVLCELLRVAFVRNAVRIAVMFKHRGDEFLARQTAVAHVQVALLAFRQADLDAVARLGTDDRVEFLDRGSQADNPDSLTRYAPSSVLTLTDVVVSGQYRFLNAARLNLTFAM